MHTLQERIAAQCIRMERDTVLTSKLDKIVWENQSNVVIRGEVGKKDPLVEEIFSLAESQLR